jgi:hypothetical protein
MMSDVPRCFVRILLFVCVCFIGAPALSQERRPLSIADIETLLGGKVGQDRVAELIRERGVNFSLDPPARSRLESAGVSATFLGVVEKAAAEYAQKQAKEPQVRKVEEAKQKATDESRNQEKTKKKELETERLKESRTKELEPQGKKTGLASGPEIDPKNPIAPAPPCADGMRLEYRSENGERYSREVKKLGNGLCSMGRYYYDSRWVIAKIVDITGREIQSADVLFPRIGQSWLSFPLSIGKTWSNQYRANHKSGGVSRYATFTDSYTVLAYENVSVPAGNFMAFKIRLRQDGDRAFSDGRRGRTYESIYGSRYYWYVPEIGNIVKQSSPVDESSSSYFWSNDSADWGDDDFELISVTWAK